LESWNRYGKDEWHETSPKNGGRTNFGDFAALETGWKKTWKSLKPEFPLSLSPSEHHRARDRRAFVWL
jgi:hypothetical protein